MGLLSHPYTPLCHFQGNLALTIVYIYRRPLTSIPSDVESRSARPVDYLYYHLRAKSRFNNHVRANNLDAFCSCITSPASGRGYRQADPNAQAVQEGQRCRGAGLHRGCVAGRYPVRWVGVLGGYCVKIYGQVGGV